MWCTCVASCLLFIVQLGTDILKTMNYLTSHQCMVISLPGIDAFIKSDLYFPLGDATYVESVSDLLHNVH